MQWTFLAMSLQILKREEVKKVDIFSRQIDSYKCFFFVSL